MTLWRVYNAMCALVLWLCVYALMSEFKPLRLNIKRYGVGCLRVYNVAITALRGCFNVKPLNFYTN